MVICSFRKENSAFLKYNQNRLISNYNLTWINMTQIVIEKKKYFLVPERDYIRLQRKAALKTKPEKILSVDEARSYSKKLIKKWAGEK